MNNIDYPEHNDNRSYVYTDEMYMRAEFPLIAQWVTASSSVIDLGCGNGALMKYLLEKKQVRIEGIDISVSGVHIAEQQGLRARVGQIDQSSTYSAYADKYFDYAICNVTMQMVMYPEVLLAQMARIAKQVIISFPNFAYIGNRMDLLIHGVMPRPLLYGYTWYATGHIHQLSIRDFRTYCEAHSWKIVHEEYLGRLMGVVRVRPNLFAKEALYLCKPSS